MRTETIYCKDRRTAVRRCPWAAIIVKVDGGYTAFETMHDYRVRKGQK
jgi:hypothetical protein